MPTYEYQCEKCGHCFEDFQKITAQPLKTCPKCKGGLKRLIGAGSGIIFKGPGFYATDHRSKEYAQEKQKEEAPPCKSKTCSSCPLNEKEKR
ncbi:MAG: FmdB family zinc ribbon protein [Candidatus Omnitrophota bacterium]